MLALVGEAVGPTGAGLCVVVPAAVLDWPDNMGEAARTSRDFCLTSEGNMAVTWGDRGPRERGEVLVVVDSRPEVALGLESVEAGAAAFLVAVRWDLLTLVVPCSAADLPMAFGEGAFFLFFEGMATVVCGVLGGGQSVTDRVGH